MDLARIVIDTNIIYSAQRSQLGTSSKLISLIGTGLFEMHISNALAIEYEDVLSRYQNELGLSNVDIEDLIDAFCALSIRHDEIYFRWRPELPDVGDEFILNLAVIAQCHYIITFNVKDFRGSEKFGVEAIRPKDFLQLIGAI
ncbi:MAG: putative toxin-antitoxin system toxin component, PIN family [Anaerolineae bacterium]